jgi:hypothetical protein
MTILASKICFKCGVPKPLDDFYKHPAMADGRLGKCKDCAKVDSTTRRWNKLEEVREYDRQRGSLPHRLEANRERQKEKPEEHLLANKRYSEKYPERKFARQTASNAIRDGKLIRFPCVVCGDPDSEGHHDDYSKPLDVMWLCDKHHKQRHKELRNGQREHNRELAIQRKSQGSVQRIGP